MNLGLKFTPQEERNIKDRYDVKGNGRISWKQFANQIEKSFSSGDMQHDPSLQTVDAPELWVYW